MLGRKKFSPELLQSLEDEQAFDRRPGKQEQTRPTPSDSSSRIRTYTDGSSLGIFKRGKQYDELLNDATSSSIPGSGGWQNGDAAARTSLSDGETESGSTSRRAASGKGQMGQRSGSGSLADGLLSRLNLKEKREEKRAHMPMSYSKVGGLGNTPETAGDALDGKEWTPPSSKVNSFTRRNGSSIPRGKGPPAKVATATRTPTPMTKKSRMQSTDVNYDSTSFEELKDEERPTEPGSRTARSEGSSPFEAAAGANPVTLNRTPDNANAFARSSPSLMSTAAKLAASIQQGSRRALGRRKSGEAFALMEDSATDTSTDADSPSEDMVRLDCEVAPTPLSGGTDATSVSTRRDSSRPARFTNTTSPGAMQPLLQSSDNSAALPSPNQSPQPSPVILDQLSSQQKRLPEQQFSQNPTGHSPPLRPRIPRFPTTVGRHQQGAETSSRSAPLLGDGNRIGNTGSTGSKAHETAGGRGNAESYDIFEPRPEGSTNPPNTTVTSSLKATSTPQSLSSIRSMKGHEALHALQRGCTLRKKWVSSTSAVEAAQAPKTERLIRCRIEGSKVVLHYHHQGVKGLLDKEEVVTHVQRVEVLDGPWVKGDCILLHTGRGVLALEAPDATTHATWMLGLNAALVSCQTRRRDVLLQAPVHAIPRNSMFVVTAPP